MTERTLDLKNGGIAMKVNEIILPSSWGREVSHKHFVNHSTSLVVLFPGKKYSCDLPLLYYASMVALKSNHDVLKLEYGYQSARIDIDFNSTNLDMIVEESLSAIKQVAHSYEELIFVSKSLGTLVAGKIAQELGNDTIEHVYLTPLDYTIPYIKISKGIVIYGTNDSVFSSESADIVNKLSDIKAYPIQGADHALELDRIQDSYDAMGQILLAYQEMFN
jgi:hypothetical protein